MQARVWIGILIAVAIGTAFLRAEDTASAARMKADVLYLASPALKGRKADTDGAALARKMIETRFEELGLAKWAKEKEYGLPFAYGTNVMGILPGSDPALASEIVLVSAHYDHVGSSDGLIYPGAADNASGVAAMLEAARDLSQPGRRPRRTVAFAAFDAEEKMMFGSFAFSLRPEVAAAEIVAVVNIDMLGRKFLDTVENAVFVVGSEGYPTVRESMRAAGRDAGVRVFPIANDLVGPRSDHVPFQDRGVPALFFSCGEYVDYHQPSDTVDRLDFGVMERSARVILTTIKGLADGALIARDPAHQWEEDELQTIQPVFQELLAQPTVARIGGSSLKGFQKMAAEADRFLREGGYDSNARRDMLLEATPALATRLGMFAASNVSLPDDFGSATGFDTAARLTQYFNITYPSDLRQAYRDAIAQVLQHQPGPFRTMPRFEREIYRIDPKETHLMETTPGVFRLAAPAAWFTLVVDPRPSLFSFRSTPLEISVGANPFEEEGSREALTDYWLLELRDAQAHPQRIDPIRAVLRLVLGTEPEAGYTGAVAKRLKQGGFHNESEWISRIMRSEPHWLATRAMKVAEDETAPMPEALADLIRDRTAPADTRLRAILAAKTLRSRPIFVALSDVINDRTLSSSTPRTRSPIPLSTLEKLLRMDAPAGTETWARTARSDDSVGDLAWGVLQKVSGKNFARDVTVWRAWAAKQPEINSEK